MITVYSKAGCGFCTIAKDYLTRHNFEFEEVRIDLDETKLAWIKAQGHRTVPQIYYKGSVLVEGGGLPLSKLEPVAVKKLMENIDATTSL
jgi:glutaredoxin 3